MNSKYTSVYGSRTNIATGIVFYCKHNLIHSYIQSLNPILKILEFKYLQIQHKACLSPFLVTNWPQRHNLFHENPLTPRPPCSSPHQRFHMKSRVQFKFSTPKAWGSNSPPPGRLWLSNSLLPRTAKVSNTGGGEVEALIWPIHFVHQNLIYTNLCFACSGSFTVNFCSFFHSLTAKQWHT